MAKVVGSFASVTGGVSEQIKQDRRSGQMAEQVNMVSDPVRGVARRHGSVNRGYLGWVPSLTMADTRMLPLARQFREFSFFMDGSEYSMMYRSQPSTNGALVPLCALYNKSTKAWVPVVFSTDASMATFKAQGLNSMTTVGDYLVASGNSIIPSYSQTDQYQASIDQGAVWIRGGAYSRTYTITLRRRTDNVSFTASYTTMQSSYPNLLDTSDIPSTATDYQKQVNDRVNAYNSAATKWLGDAYASQQPANIAAQLVASFNSQGFTNIAISGSTIVMNVINQLAGDDHGDGSLLWTVFDTIDAPEKVSPIHFDGKVVQVKAEGQLDAYYLKFVSDTGTNYNPGTWIECPAQLVQPNKAFLIGCFNAAKTSFYMGVSPTDLTTISGVTAPSFEPSQAGDIGAQGNKPYFLDHPISCLATFADRLVIISNGVVFMSRSGDYFNWFRKSALTVAADDPIEVYALGQEDDIISRSIVYNRDLFMFGVRNQYTISGRAVIDASNPPPVSQAAAEHDTNYARPAVAGNVLFYGRYRATRGTIPYAGAIAQFQLGLFEDTPETYTVSSQLDKYISGRPIEMTTMSEPTTLFVRSDAYDYGLYVYSFVDSPGNDQRVFDSWSRWEWHEKVGTPIGITTFDSSLLVFTMTDDGASIVLACEEFTMESEVADEPYLDSRTAYIEDRSAIGIYNSWDESVACFAFAQPSTRFLLGATLSKEAEYLTKFPTDMSTYAQMGLPYDSYVEITPPYLRDRNDRAILTGDLTIQNYTVSVSDTGGMDGELLRGTTVQTSTMPLKFNGRVLGRANNLVGQQPVSSQVLTMPVGTARDRHRVIFHARKWLPLCISEIEWSGQTFNNSRRV